MKVFYCLVFIGFIIFSTGCKNDNTPSSIITDVLVGGTEQNGGKHIAKYWKNGTPVILSDGTQDAVVLSVAASGNDVYAAGYEFVLRTDMSGTYAVLVAKYWKNGVDITLNDTQDFTTSYASSIAVSVSDVYMAGYTNGGVSGGVFKIAKYWKNGVTVNLTNGLTYDAEANSIIVIGSDVYVAGIEKNAAGNTVAKYWKNGTAVKLTDGTRNAAANSITVSGSDVYVAGYELDNTYNYVAKYWKNGTAFALTDGS